MVKGFEELRGGVVAVPSGAGVCLAYQPWPFVSGVVRERGKDFRGAWGELTSYVGGELLELVGPPVGGVA